MTPKTPNHINNKPKCLLCYKNKASKYHCLLVFLCLLLWLVVFCLWDLFCGFVYVVFLWGFFLFYFGVLPIPAVYTGSHGAWRGLS